MKQILKNHLTAWDGKHVAYLSVFYQEFHNTDGFIVNIIALYIENQALEKATTWLLKYHYDNHSKLSNKQIDVVISKVNHLNHWESQLHILQLIPMFKIDRKQAEMRVGFITKALDSDKKFVRAAAYEAYFEVVKLIPELANEFKQRCELALSRESASVQVKIKRILVILDSF